MATVRTLDHVNIQTVAETAQFRADMREPGRAHPRTGMPRMVDAGARGQAAYDRGGHQVRLDRNFHGAWPPNMPAMRLSAVTAA